MADFKMSVQEYEALLAFARKGATTDESVRALDSFVTTIEKKNGVVRHALWIQWQEAGKQVAVAAKFPAVWPPELRFYLELLTRPISKADVVSALAKKARKPLNVMVTPDPAALVGWTLLDTYFENG